MQLLYKCSPNFRLAWKLTPRSKRQTWQTVASLRMPSTGKIKKNTCQHCTASKMSLNPKRQRGGLGRSPHFCFNLLYASCRKHVRQKLLSLKERTLCWKPGLHSLRQAAESFSSKRVLRCFAKHTDMLALRQTKSFFGMHALTRDFITTHLASEHLEGPGTGCKR